MAGSDPVGKTILQLTLVNGEIDKDKTYIEIHIVGQPASQRVPLSTLAVKGLSAMEVVQLTHPEVKTDEDFINFISGVDGKSSYQLAKDAGYAGTLAQYLESLKGTNGKSAYELAKDGGFTGTQAEFLAGLKGTNGKDGTNGKSAFELVQAGGYTGTQAEWLESLKGKNAFELAKAGGFTGTLVEYLASLKGAKGDNGKSAYDLAKDGGYTGTLAEYLESLKGAAGKSAFEIAKAGGYNGTEAEWLASLKGAKGLSAFEVAAAGGYTGTEAEWIASLKGEKGDKGDTGATAVLGNLVGSVATTDELPDVADFAQSDYFFVGTHVYMNLNGEWTDMGDFKGPAGKDGTGLTILGELPSTAYLPAEGEKLGDTWLIGESMYVWNAVRWQKQGQEGLQGEKGDEGKEGKEGKSAFDTVRTAYPEIDTMAKYVEFIRGLKGDKGDAAVAFIPVGILTTAAELPDTEEDGHGYLVGNDTDGYEFHVFTGGEWANMGNNVGPQGPEGKEGKIGPQGPVGRAMTPKGELAGTNSLPTEGNVVGDYYSINGRFHAWDGIAFIDLGNFKGVQGDKGEKGDVGQPVNAKGELANEAALPATAAIGDGYEIGGYIYVYGSGGFVRMGQWRGAAGRDGANGKSAFELAKAGGFAGTEAEFLKSLKGKDGVSFEFIGQFANSGNLPTGDQTGKSAVVMTNPPHLWLWAQDTGWFDAGPAGAQGPQGPTGAAGKPMLFKGSVAAVNQLPANAELADTYLVGETFHTWTGAAYATFPAFRGPAGVSLTFVGDFASEAALPLGTISQVATAANYVYIHNGSAWVKTGPVGSQGEEGKSAYELAVEDGFVGDLTAYLASLKGDKGDTGKSLYQDAVDSGLFSGTLEDFILSQKGATGASAFQGAIDEGKLGPTATFDDFIGLIRGPQGEEGEPGPRGETGSAIRILGTVANEAALPAVGQVSTGYAIPDTATPGTYNCFVWLDTTNSWFNLGHVVGAQGPKGDQGLRGLQGVKGEKGEKGEIGTIWIVFDRDPQAVDGRINDYFFNRLTQQFFRKTDQVTWTPLGYIGGGNLNAPTADGKRKLMLDGQWVDAPLLNALPPTDDGLVYQLVNGQWVAFDIYTLKVVDAANTVDWKVARQFRLTNTVAGARTINLTNIPGADRAATVVVKVYGKVAAFNWTLGNGKTIRWFDGAAPTFANDTTTVVFNWDGQEMVGSVPN